MKKITLGIIVVIVLSVGIWLISYDQDSSFRIAESIMDSVSAPSEVGSKIELSESMSMENP